MKKFFLIGFLLICTSVGSIAGYKFFAREKSDRYKVRVAACLILSDGNSTVLGLRKNENKYGLIGGHLEKGETIYQALIREAKEEADIDLEEKDLEVVHVLHYSNFYDYIFFFVQAKNWRGAIRNMEPEKCAGWEWFTNDELPNNLTSWASKGLENIQKGTFFCDYRRE